MNEKKITGCLLAIIVFLLIIPSVIWKGFVLSVLWGWFIVPKFGLPPLQVADAIAIALIVSSLTHQYFDAQSSEKSATEKMGAAIASMIFTPAFALLTGWIVRHWTTG